MCGIFGISLKRSENLPRSITSSILESLFILSESRGKAASGISFFANNGIIVEKVPFSAKKFVASQTFKQLIQHNMLSIGAEEILAVLGHTRLDTHGTAYNVDNNSPISYKNIIGVHNGIIVNTAAILEKYPLLERRGEVDSSILFSLFNYIYEQKRSWDEATRIVFQMLEGSASIAAFLPGEKKLILATNTGSLYVCECMENSVIFYASERSILERIVRRHKVKRYIGSMSIVQVKPNECCCFSVETLEKELIPLRLNIRIESAC